ncbi:hypothetical protein F5141DRAFT_1169855 [Pisolithus sp. B1]|nr:hypothetical protein F5141DRAFT_1169855 [Pisolithus sp. B1]
MYISVSSQLCTARLVLLFVHHIPYLTACPPSRSTIVTRSNVIRHVKRRMLLRLRRLLFTERVEIQGFCRYPPGTDFGYVPITDRPVS